MFKSNNVPSKRYHEAEDTSAVNKPGNVVSRARRALGDITNSFGIGAEGQGKEANKKPTLSAPSSSVYPESVVPTSRVEEAEDTAQFMIDDPNRHYMKRESDNIDARDGQNPLLCTAYINDMYDLFHEQERSLQVSPSYMTGQPNVNERMRAILVDWLVCYYSLHDLITYL